MSPLKWLADLVPPHSKVNKVTLPSWYSLKIVALRCTYTYQQTKIKIYWESRKSNSQCSFISPDVYDTPERMQCRGPIRAYAKLSPLFTLDNYYEFSNFTLHKYFEFSNFIQLILHRIWLLLFVYYSSNRPHQYKDYLYLNI